MLMDRDQRPERIGCRYENFVSALACQLLARISTGKLRPERTKDLLHKHKEIEHRLGAKVRFATTADITKALEAAAHEPNLARFIIEHTVRPLPRSIIRRCYRIVNLLLAP
jgi:hypothetical protein